MENAIQKLAQECICSKSTVSFVGGGGKTTAIFLLAAYLRRQGIDAAVTTTTHFHIPPFADPHIPVYGKELGQKLAPPDNIDEVIRRHQAVLIEADGAKGRPFKAPAAHEPVLHPATTHVVIVGGLSALGQTIAEKGFRTEELCRILSCGPDHIITAEDMAKVLLSPLGGRKSAEHLPCTLLLNQADTKKLQAQAEIIERAAHAAGIKTVTAALLEEVQA